MHRNRKANTGRRTIDGSGRQCTAAQYEAALEGVAKASKHYVQQPNSRTIVVVQAGDSGRETHALTTFLHAFHTLVVSFLLFQFFYEHWHNLADALIRLDELQKYGFSIAIIFGCYSLSHLFRCSVLAARSTLGVRPKASRI